MRPLRAQQRKRSVTFGSRVLIISVLRLTCSSAGPISRAQRRALTPASPGQTEAPPARFSSSDLQWDGRQRAASDCTRCSAATSQMASLRHPNDVYVAALWRYPVKSMAGEPLCRIGLSASGFAGDRIVQVYRPNGHVATARTCPGLLSHRATLDASGEPLVDGRPWTDPGVLADVRRHVEPGATLARDESDDRFDVLPLLVTTDGAVAAFGRDVRRLRPNLVIGGVEGLAERSWAGGELRIGDVRVGIQGLRRRCVMTTFDPDTQVQDPTVVRDLAARFDLRFALDGFVIHGGDIALGQAVDLVMTAPSVAPGVTP
jgi:hypothetical protein